MNSAGVFYANKVWALLFKICPLKNLISVGCLIVYFVYLNCQHEEDGAIFSRIQYFFEQNRGY